MFGNCGIMAEMKEEIPNFQEPPRKEFSLPYVLLALQRLGGSGSATEVTGELANEFKLKDEILEKKTLKIGAPVFRNQVQFARKDLVYAGYIDNAERGVWKMTKKAADRMEDLAGREEDVLNAFREEVIKLSQAEEKKRREEREKEKTDAEEYISEDMEMEGESEKEKMLTEDLERIKELDPYAFERLCAQLFKSYGYEDVDVTKKSGDGGIDGYGFLVFELVRFKVVFQAKKYGEQKATPDHIKLLNQSKQEAKAEKAVFITTSDFTREAKNIGNENNIEMINGMELMEILYEKGIGYSKKYDERFFKGI